MKVIFNPDETLTAYELWQVLRLFYGPLMVNEMSVPTELAHLFEPDNNPYERNIDTVGSV